MKKIGNINRDISEVVASMGHLDTLTIADAGLPIPDGVRRIDLAVRQGVPAFMQAVEAVYSELCVQEIIIAQETTTVSPQVADDLKRLFKDVHLRVVPHEELKRLTAKSKTVIRTGEFTPYANVILVAGVVF
ncbi:MAG: D-ribose pyranase [Chloroflexi bacterium]|nr:D-ribose pyranase [Chloroflexota bacterium]